MTFETFHLSVALNCNIRFFLYDIFPVVKWPFTKNKKNGQPSMLVKNQHRWLSLSCLGLKLRLRLRLSLRKAYKPRGCAVTGTCI
jgi:hypothetical protein